MKQKYMDYTEALLILEYFQNSNKVQGMNKYKIDVIEDARRKVDERAELLLNLYGSLKEEEKKNGKD
jgi:hypothetical protein